MGKRKNRLPRLCFVSSSGGHWEQLQKLEPLAIKYKGFFVTERTKFKAPLGNYLDKGASRFCDYNWYNGCVSILFIGCIFS